MSLVLEQFYQNMAAVGVSALTGAQPRVVAPGFLPQSRAGT